MQLLSLNRITRNRGLIVLATRPPVGAGREVTRQPSPEKNSPHGYITTTLGEELSENAISSVRREYSDHSLGTIFCIFTPH